jgi:DNA-binding NtrC family response regulator
MIRFKDKDVQIFLVDDDEIQLKMLETKFATDLSNYKIYSFLSGEELLSHFSENPPQKRNISILVLDYYLKSSDNKEAKDGIDILKDVKELYPSLEVVIISAYDDEENIKDLVIEMGAIDFVKKGENAFTLIHNIIMRLISQKMLYWKKVERNVALIVFLSIVSISALLYFIFA